LPQAWLLDKIGFFRCIGGSGWVQWVQIKLKIRQSLGALDSKGLRHERIYWGLNAHHRMA